MQCAVGVRTCSPPWHASSLRAMAQSTVSERMLHAGHAHCTKHRFEHGTQAGSSETGPQHARARERSIEKAPCIDRKIASTPRAIQASGPAHKASRQLPKRASAAPFIQTHPRTTTPLSPPTLSPYPLSPCPRAPSLLLRSARAGVQRFSLTSPAPPQCLCDAGPGSDAQTLRGAPSSHVPSARPDGTVSHGRA
jgi:hypothetical protein